MFKLGSTLATFLNWTGDIFRHVADLAADIPLITDAISWPFYDLATRCYQASIDVRGFDDWIADVDFDLGKILSWDTIKDLIGAAWDMSRLDDILSWLDIQQKIEDVWDLTNRIVDFTIEQASLILKVDDLARDLLDLIDPVNWAVRTVNALVDIAEDLAEDIARIAYKVANKVWDAKIWD